MSDSILTGETTGSVGEARGTARSSRGPATVINPERRPAPGPLAAAPSGSGAAGASSIIRQLFPPDDGGRPADFDAPRGVVLGHFSIIERIRSGGMGAVFRALDTRLGRDVALKALPPALSRDPLIVQRFKNEAQAAAQLDHDNIARVYYIGEEQGLHFIAFEFVVGTNLRDLIHEQGRLPVAEAVSYGLQAASALVHTAARGVVHRDIKPSNIIITPAGRAKLVDLGLARQENRDEEGADLTLAGTTLGTFDYISPEQARDPRAADVRSDIYSLGCTLYHMLTGDPPYPEGTVLQKLLQHQGDDAPDPSARNRSVPPDLAIVVRKMMAKDPRRRYQTADELLRDLTLVAEAVGLCPVSPEGAAWVRLAPDHSTFWTRHLAWIATAGALLAIVAVLEYGVRWGALRNLTGEGPRPRERTGVEPARTKASERPLRESSSGRTGAMRSGARGVPPVDASELIGRGNPVARPRVREAPQSPDERESPFTPFRLTDDDRPARGFALGPGEQGPLPWTSEVFDPQGMGLRTTGPGRPERADESASGSRASGRTESAASDDTQRRVEVPPAADEVFVLIGRDGSPERRFRSLAAAYNECKDGAVIELRYDGRIVEEGLRITRRVTIRAARGRRPVIEFQPSRVVTDPNQMRAIALSSGALEIVGVDLVLTVNPTISTEQWNLFSIERADRLRLQGVTATVSNSGGQSAAMFELRAGAGAMMPDMPMVGAAPRAPLELEIEDSLLRGECDLISVRNVDPVRLAIRQSVVAVRDSLLAVFGGLETAPDAVQLELRLDHVTAGLGRGLLTVDVGPLPRKCPPLSLQVQDSILSNSGQAPLVSMTGQLPPQEFRGLLTWSAKNNVYDRFDAWWRIEGAPVGDRSDPLDFPGWRRHWSEAGEINPRSVAGGERIWSRPQWMEKAYSELSAADFILDRQRPGNPAVAGADNASDAGANLKDNVPRGEPPSTAAGDRRRT